jgi:hypothetical protein
MLKAPLYSTLSIAWLSTYILVTRQLSQVISMVSPAASLTKRLAPDLEATQSALSSILTNDGSISAGAVFFLINLWHAGAIIVLVVLINLVISRAENPSGPSDWWRHPGKSLASISGGLTTGLGSVLRTLAMDAQIHGVRTLMRKASWRTLVRLTLFLANVTMSVILLRQAMSLAYLAANPSSNTTFSTALDLASTQTALIVTAKSLSPTLAFLILNGILVLFILNLALAYNSLLHPKGRTSSSAISLASFKSISNQLQGSPRILNALKAIALIAVVMGFAMGIIFAQEIIKYVNTSYGNDTGTTALAYVNVLMLFGVPAMLYVAIQVEDVVKGWNLFSCFGRG